MTVPSLMERLKAVPVAPVAPQTLHGATEKNDILRGENASVAPVAPKKERGQSENQKSPSDWTPSPPAPDPGIAPLLALAMALCDRTGASDKARQDWRTDIEQTPPGLRGDLQRYLQSQLPMQASAPAKAPVQTPVPKPLPKFHVAQPWNVADRTYQAHHWSCPTCKAAARSGGHSARCTEGQQLHSAYEQAAAK